MNRLKTLERILPNGLELVVLPTNAPVVSVQAWVDVGSIDEDANEAGFCHFLEHMLFKGTKKRTTQEIAGSIEGSGGEMNAFTSFEQTVYHITLSNKKWELANEILADMVLGSTFVPTEFNPEKEVILEEIKRGDDSPDRQIYQDMYSSLYGSEGYGRPVIGFPKTVSACKPGVLKKFWQKWYHPELMTVIVCGDIDPLEVEKIILKTWGKAGKKSAPLRKRRRILGVKQVLQNKFNSFHSKPFPMNSVRWIGALPGCSILDSVMPALDLSSSILGQGETSRLHQRLFRQEGLVTSVGCGVWAPLGIGSYNFDVETSVDKGLKFKGVLFDEIERFCKEGPTTDEMDRAKIAIETDRIYGSQTMDGLASRLGYLKTVTGDINFDLEYMARVRELTREDVQQASKQYLLQQTGAQKNVMRECVLYPKDIDTKKLFGNNKSTVVNVAKAAKPVAVVQKPEMIRLSNGIELVLFPRNDLPIVTIQSCTFGGLRTENSKNLGVGNLLSEIWEKGPRGTTSENFNKTLESKASRIDAFSGRNSLGLSCTTLTHYMEDVLPLFTKTLFDPALDSKELEMVRDVTLEEIKTLEDDSGRLVGKLFCETLFEGHPYMYPLIGNQQTVSSMKPEALIAQYRQTVGSSSLVVSLSGKFNVAQVLSHFEKIDRKNFERAHSNPLSYSPPKAPREIEVKKGREQSHLICGFSGLTITSQERYVLRLMLTILGGQSGRLFTELRDKQGLCYTVAPVSFEGIEAGYVGAYIGCDPAKRKQALEGIKKELEKICTKKVSEKELKRAKEFMLGRQHIDMQLNSSISTASAFNTLYGLPFDEHLRIPEQVEKISATQIQKLARSLFEKPMITAVVV